MTRRDMEMDGFLIFIIAKILLLLKFVVIVAVLFYGCEAVMYVKNFGAKPLIERVWYGPKGK